jgi:hypothetical protein
MLMLTLARFCRAFKMLGRNGFIACVSATYFFLNLALNGLQINKGLNHFRYYWCCILST